MNVGRVGPACSVPRDPLLCTMRGVPITRRIQDPLHEEEQRVPARLRNVLRAKHRVSGTSNSARRPRVRTAFARQVRNHPAVSPTQRRAQTWSRVPIAAELQWVNRRAVRPDPPRESRPGHTLLFVPRNDRRDPSPTPQTDDKKGSDPLLLSVYLGQLRAAISCQVLDFLLDSPSSRLCRLPCYAAWVGHSGLKS